MRHFLSVFVCSAVLPVLSSSCSFLEHAPASSAEADSCSLVATIQRAGGISNFTREVDVFIYNDEGLLESFYKDDISSGMLKLVSCSGTKTAVATANIPAALLDYEHVSTYSGLKSVLCEFRNEDVASPVMYGELDYSTSDHGMHIMELKPLMCRVEIRYLDVDFTDTPYRGCTLENASAYILNAYARMHLDGVVDGSEILNEGAYDYFGHDPERNSGMLYSNGASGAVFYCYPGDDTRLVIEGEIEGHKYYYGMNLRVSSGQEFLRGENLVYDIILKMKGTADCQTDADSDAMTVSFTVSPWVESEEEVVPMAVSVNGDDSDLTRGSLGDENGIWDLNIWVYDEYASSVVRRFIQYPGARYGGVNLDLRLLHDVRYRVFVLANAGFDVGPMGLEDLLEWRLYLSVPEGNLRGVAMSAMGEYKIPKGSKGIDMKLDRLMSKVSVSFDASALDSDVSMVMTRARVMNCPRSVCAFSSSKAVDSDDMFSLGYSQECLNSAVLYLCENLRGEDDTLASYVELEFIYESSKYRSVGRGLVYRFHIKDGKNSAAVRNRHYRYILRPSGDGLGSSDSWALDRSNLVEKT